MLKTHHSYPVFTVSHPILNGCGCMLSHVRLLATLCAAAHHAPLSMGFVRQDYSMCHFLLQWIFLKVKVLVAQLSLTLCDPMDCSPWGFSIHGIFQARILKWFAIPFSRRSLRPRISTWVSCFAGRFFNHWAIREVFTVSYPILYYNFLSKYYNLSLAYILFLYHTDLQTWLTLTLHGFCLCTKLSH